MKKMFSWIGEKVGDENRPGARNLERAAVALSEAFSAAAGGDMKAAEKLFEESITTYRSLGMRREEAGANHAYAVVLAGDSSFTMAFDYFNAAIEMYLHLALKPELAATLRDAGVAEAEYSNSDKAWASLNESLALFEELEDASGKASVLRAMGGAAQHDEDFEAARDYVTQSLILYNELGESRRAALCLVQLGRIAVDQSDFDAAGSRYFESIKRYCEGRGESLLTGALTDLGTVPFMEASEHHVSELLDAAVTIYALEQANADSMGSDNDDSKTFTAYRNEMSACLTLAPVAYSQDNREMAKSLFERAISLAGELSDSLLCYVFAQASRTAYRNDDLDPAREYYSRLKELAEAGDLQSYRAIALIGLAHIAQRFGDIAYALSECEIALEVSKALNDVAGTARILTLYGDLKCDYGDPETGVKLLRESVALCRRSDDAPGAARAQERLGAASTELDADFARVCLTECAESDDTDDFTAAAALQTLAELELVEGELAEAYELSCKSLNLRKDIRDRSGVASSLETCAHVAIVWGDIETAAVMLSKSDEIVSTTGAPREARSQTRHDENVAALRAELSDVDFENAWQEGQELSLEEIADEIVLLLDDIEPDDDGEMLTEDDDD